MERGLVPDPMGGGHIGGSIENMPSWYHMEVFLTVSDPVSSNSVQE